jgi:hypothetical protein
VVEVLIQSERILKALTRYSNPAKIQVICDCPSPTTLTELQSFFGLAKFYHNFMLGFSHISWALNQVTKGGGRAKFVWGKEQQ